MKVDLKLKTNSKSEYIDFVSYALYLSITMFPPEKYRSYLLKQRGKLQGQSYKDFRNLANTDPPTHIPQ